MTMTMTMKMTMTMTEEILYTQTDNIHTIHTDVVLCTPPLPSPPPTRHAHNTYLHMLTDYFSAGTLTFSELRTQNSELRILFNIIHV